MNFEDITELNYAVEAGRKAQELLEHPTFREVTGELLAHYSAMTFSTTPDAKADREALYHQHVAVQTIIETLKSRVNSGLAAQEELEVANGG